MTSLATSGQLQFVFVPPLPSPISMSQSDLVGKSLKWLKAGTFKIYCHVALDSLYIWTGNDVIIYFQLAANRMVIQVLYSLFCNPSDIFTPWHRKWDSNGPTVVYGLHKSQTTQASNAQIYTDKFLEGICNFAGYDVIINFWSAANGTDVFILGHVQVAISWLRFEKV